MIAIQTPRLSRWLTAFGALLAVGVIVAVAADFHRRHQAAVEEAERRMSSLTSMLSEHVARTFETIDRALIQVAEAYDDYLNAPAERRLSPYETLRTIHAGSPILNGLGWVNEHGDRIHNSLSRTLLPLNIASQEHFAVQRDSPDRGLYISHPFRSVLDGQWLIPVTRRMYRPDGSFGGVALSGINLGYFMKSYGNLNLGRTALVAMFRDDGTTLIREPLTLEFIGRSVGKGVLFTVHLPRSPSGTFHAVSPLDGVSRIAAYSAVPGLPLVVALSIERSEVLEAWWTSLWQTVPVALLIAISILTGAFVLAAQLRRNEQQQLALAAAKAQAESARVSAEEARDRAQRADQAKSEFLATMSHEIRTPLNAILGMNSLLLESKLGREQRDWAETVRDSGVSLLTIIGDVLDAAKLEAGRITIEAVEFDLAPALEKAVFLLSPKAAEKTLSLTVDIDASARRRVRGDPTRLRQVLLNLVDNAVKFTDRGQVTVAARLAPRGDGRATLAISVTDTGIGISAEAQLQLFQKFSQADATVTRRFGGTGLGLAISQELVRLMGGDIDVTSEPGRGSCFSFTLEVVEIGPEAVLPEALSAAPATPAVSDRPVHILVVDDNPANRAFLSTILLREGYSVDFAVDGAQAAQSVSHGRYDIILMDVRMEGVGGVEATQRIRSLGDERARVPIVALTADATAGTRDACLAAGMNDYLTKPVVRDELFAKIARWTKPMGDDTANPAPTPAVPTGESDLDEAHLAALEGIGQADKLRPLIEIFLSTADTRLARLAEIGAAGDLATLKSVAHDLAGLAGNFGARKLDRLARRVMSECEGGNRKAIAATLGEVSSAAAAALAALRARYLSPAVKSA